MKYLKIENWSKLSLLLRLSHVADPQDLQRVKDTLLIQQWLSIIDLVEYKIKK